MKPHASALLAFFLAACDPGDHSPPVHFVLPNDFRGEIRIEQGVAEASDPPLEDGHYTIRVPSSRLVRVKTMELFSHWHKERAFSASGRELPVLSGHGEQPDVTALRNLGMFDDAANNLPPYTFVYMFGTWHDAENLLDRFHENFRKATPRP